MISRRGGVEWGRNLKCRARRVDGRLRSGDDSDRCGMVGGGLKKFECAVLFGSRCDGSVTWRAKPRGALPPSWGCGISHVWTFGGLCIIERKKFQIWI